MIDRSSSLWGVPAAGVLLVCLLAYPLSLSAHPPYAILRYARVKPPALPERCSVGDAIKRAKNHWLVFSSRTCQACRELLHALERRRGYLARRGIAVINVLTDASSCPSALFEGRRMGTFPVARAEQPLADQWGVAATPTTYMLRDGRVVLKVLGKAPVKVLLSLYGKTR